MEGGVSDRGDTDGCRDVTGGDGVGVGVGARARARARAYVRPGCAVRRALRRRNKIIHRVRVSYLCTHTTMVLYGIKHARHNIIYCT